MTGGLWIGILLGAALAAALGWLWRRRAGAPAPQLYRTRTGRTAAPPGAFAPTQLDSILDTVLDARLAEPPRRIGHYVVERDIGRGAMGMVLMCRDERNGEAVAVKTMALGREFHGDGLEEARERFFREAEMAGRLQHPDIVSVREAGEEDGVAYIAMELLSGRVLSEFAQPVRL